MSVRLQEGPLGGGSLRTNSDITERKRAEQELAESEARFRALAESSPLAIFVSRDKKVVLANPACAKLFGAPSPENLIGKTALDLFDPASRSLVRERIRVDSEEVPLVEVRILRLDGTPVDVEATASPFLDQGVKAIQVLLRDITERKQAEEGLAESEARYRLLTESSQDLIFIIDRDDRVRYVNSAAAQALRRSPGDVVGRSRTELFDAETSAAMGLSLDRAFESGESMHAESELTYPSGSAWIATMLVPIKDNDNVTAVFGVSRDITERKRAEQELAESEARFRALAESSPLAIFVNRNDKVFLANPACAKLFGASSPEDLLGKTALDLFDPASRSLVRERIRVDSEEVPLVEVRIVRLDGTPVDVEATASPFLDQGVKAIQVLLRDITERKQAEEELRRSASFLENLIDSANAPIIVWNADLRITRFNHAFERLAQRTADQVLGQPLNLLFPPEFREESLAQMGLAGRGESLENAEISILRADGEIKTVLWSSADVYDSASGGKLLA
ncbi:MAG TPA: PAS domain S-box protein, partial [Coriobacteriia bacterium]